MQLALHSMALVEEQLRVDPCVDRPRAAHHQPRRRHPHATDAREVEERGAEAVDTDASVAEGRVPGPGALVKDGCEVREGQPPDGRRRHEGVVDGPHVTQPKHLRGYSGEQRPCGCGLNLTAFLGSFEVMPCRTSNSRSRAPSGKRSGRAWGGRRPRRGGKSETFPPRSRAGTTCAERRTAAGPIARCTQPGAGRSSWRWRTRRRIRPARRAPPPAPPPSPQGC
mmetsp:Transcript_24197/g.76092  ORF Transcript_24197/g.76092 Transcript_24197/m.76092 type:complete len:224 (-) Transcript_24197:203-874(-)